MKTTAFSNHATNQGPRDGLQSLIWTTLLKKANPLSLIDTQCDGEGLHKISWRVLRHYKLKRCDLAVSELWSSVFNSVRVLHVALVCTVAVSHPQAESGITVIGSPGPEQQASNLRSQLDQN